jgi:hypothetical protein
VQVHAKQKVAVTLSDKGQLTLWHTEPPSLVAAAIGSEWHLQKRFVAATWLPEKPGSSAPLLALATDHSLLLVHLQSDSCMHVLASVDLSGASSGATTLQILCAQDAEGVLVAIHYSQCREGACAATIAVFAVTGIGSSLRLVPLGDCGLGNGWMGIGEVAGDDKMLAAATRAASELQMALFVSDQCQFVQCGAGSARLMPGADESVLVKESCNEQVNVHADLRSLVAAAIMTGPALHLVIWNLLEGLGGFQAEAGLVQQLPGGPACVRCLPPAVVRGAVALATPQQVTLFSSVSAGWAPLATISIPGTPHSLVSAHGLLFVGLNGQIAAFKPTVQLRDGLEDMNVFAEVLQAPLPLWHPCNIAAYLLCGAHSAAAQILRELIKVLSGAQKLPEHGLVTTALHTICPPCNNVAVAFTHACKEAKPANCSDLETGQLETGQLESGVFGTVRDGQGILPAPAQEQAKKRAMDTGQLEIAAFGAAGSLEGLPVGPTCRSHTDACKDVAQGLLSRHLQKAHRHETSVCTGHLDVSHMDGQMATSAASDTRAAQASSDPLCTGQLDMTSFSFSARPAKPLHTGSFDELQSGQLNMSSFAAFTTATEPPSTHKDQLQSCQVDMSSFAGFSAAPGPSSTRKDLIQSGQLDMSSCAALSSPPGPALTHEDLLLRGQLVMSSLGAPAASPAPSQSDADPLQTGHLDVSFFKVASGMPAPSQASTNHLQSDGRTVACAAKPGLDPVQTGQLDLAAFGNVMQLTAPPTQLDSPVLTRLQQPACNKEELTGSPSVHKGSTFDRKPCTGPVGEAQCWGPVDVHDAGDTVLRCPQIAVQMGSASSLAARTGLQMHLSSNRMQARPRPSPVVPIVREAHACGEAGLQSARFEDARNGLRENFSHRMHLTCSGAVGSCNSAADFTSDMDCCLSRRNCYRSCKSATCCQVCQGTDNSYSSSMGRQRSTLFEIEGCKGHCARQNSWDFKGIGRASAAKRLAGDAVAEGWEADMHGVSGSGCRSSSLEVLCCLGRGQDLASSSLQCWQELETHCCAREDCLTSEQICLLRDLVEDSGSSRCKGAGIDLQAARLLPALASAFCGMQSSSKASGTPLEDVAMKIRTLDLPGRRMVSAARLGSVLLQEDWAAARRGDTHQSLTSDEDRQSGSSSRRPVVMSSSAQKLLQRMRGDAEMTASNSQTSSHSFLEPCFASQSATPPVQLEPHWAHLGLLPTLQPTAIFWAFDCSSPVALLETLFMCMPRNEPADSDSSAALTLGSPSLAFGGAMRGTGDPNSSKAWTWENMRRLGAALWLQSAADAAHAAELVAKATFAMHRDACMVAHWYCALGKLSVLAGLMRASGNARVAAFFMRDFRTPDARAAAAKNAHKLLSQHRYSLAAAFFLCAGDVQAAFSTCLHHLHDAQLALFLARILDAASPASASGHTAELLQRLLKSESGLCRESFTEAVLTRLAPSMAVRNLTRVLVSSCRQSGMVVAASAQLQAMDWVAYTLLKCSGANGQMRAGSTFSAIEVQELARGLPGLASRAAHHAALHGACVASLRATKLGMWLLAQSAHNNSQREQAASKLVLQTARRRAVVSAVCAVLAAKATGSLQLRFSDCCASRSALSVLANHAVKEAALNVERACSAAAAEGCDTFVQQLLDDTGSGTELVDRVDVAAVLEEVRACMEKSPLTVACTHHEAPSIPGDCPDKAGSRRNAEPSSQGNAREELLNAADSQTLATVGDKDAQVRSGLCFIIPDTQVCFCACM